MSLQFFQQTVTTPLGDMVAIASATELYLLEFTDRRELPNEIVALKKEFEADLKVKTNAIVSRLKKELHAYFKGDLIDFKTPLHLNGTEFQCNVWRALLTVPYGETKTYKEQSILLGDLKAIRAVASANGKNKLAIIIPCHRIIGSDGSLTGYAGGIERKRYLLNLEREIAGPKDLFSA